MSKVTVKQVCEFYTANTRMTIVVTDATRRRIADLAPLHKKAIESVTPAQLWRIVEPWSWFKRVEALSIWKRIFNFAVTPKPMWTDFRKPRPAAPEPLIEAWQNPLNGIVVNVGQGYTFKKDKAALLEVTMTQSDFVTKQRQELEKRKAAVLQTWNKAKRPESGKLHEQYK